MWGADQKGAFQLETILEAHVDKAFDAFTAWTLRNAFDFPRDLELVLVCSAYRSIRAVVS